MFFLYYQTLLPFYLNIEITVNIIATKGSRSQITINTNETIIVIEYIEIAIGRYRSLIRIPKRYPIMDLSLCHGTKNVPISSVIERLSSSTVDSLPNFLRCLKGILTYHQFKKSCMKKRKICGYVSTFAKPMTCWSGLFCILVCSILGSFPSAYSLS